MAGQTIMPYLRDGLSKKKLPGEIPNIFLQAGISKRNIFCGKMKKNVVVYGNIHDKFVSSNLECKLKIIFKNLDIKR